MRFGVQYLVIVVLAAAGCAEDNDKPAEGDLGVDMGRSIDIDGAVPDGGGGEDDGAVIDPDEGIDPDDGVPPDMAPPTPDMLPPDVFVPPPDMFVGTDIQDCQGACDRYAQCDRLGEIFGDEGNCLATCERVSRDGRPDVWFDCLEIEACNLINRCPRPEVEPLECPELCGLAGNCEVELPFDDCEGRCGDGGDAFRACGEHLFGECNNDDFVTCLGADVFPACEEMCADAVRCNIIAAETCIPGCIADLFDADPLARLRATQRNQCVARANDEECVAIDLCVFPPDGPPPPDPNGPDPIIVACGALCEAQDTCGVLEGERAACVQGCITSFQGGGNPDIAERLRGSLDCGFTNTCDDLTACLDAASPRGECEGHCASLLGCDLGGEEGCVEACVEVWPRNRYEAFRTCVADAGDDCEGMAECSVPLRLPCPEACARLDECGINDDPVACAAICDDAHFADPIVEAERIACFLAAPECANAADVSAFTVQGCTRTPAGAKVCLGFCRALTAECAPDAEETLAECVASCGAGLAGDLGLRFSAAEPCIDALDIDAGCEDLVGCIPVDVNLDCEGYCGSADACGVPRPECAANCADDPLSQLRVLEAQRCLPELEACEDIRECIDPPLRPVDGGPPVNFDPVRFCQQWDDCFFGFGPVTCEQAQAQLFAGGGLAAQGCAQTVLQNEGCGAADGVIAFCLAGGGGEHPIGPECERLCRARGFCDEALDQAACQTECRGQLDRADPDSAGRLAPQLVCAASWSCGDLEPCLAGSEPAAVCERHCGALDGCGIMPDGCAESCDEGFSRDRQFAWRDCVRRAGDDCDAIAACAPPPLLPCDRYCGSLDDCGLGDDRCEQDCDDRHFGEPLQTALEVSCVLSAQECNDPDVLSVGACLADPEAGGTACLGFCRGITECDPQAEGDLIECVNRCVNGFGDIDGLRFAAAQDCLEGLAVDAQCAPVTACLPEELPIDCEGHCGRLDGCRIPAGGDGCLEACQGDPDADVQGCVLDALRVGAGCGGVADCVDFQPARAGIPCSRFCDVRNDCDRDVDAYLCRLDCTPAPEELNVQLGCALVTDCDDLAECLELGADLNEDCADPCAASAACGVYPNEDFCQQACTGQAASPRAREDYIESLGECIDGVVDGDVCDRDAAAECFNPSLCEGTDNVITVPSAGGRVAIDTTGLPDNYNGSCDRGGPEQVVSISIRARAQVTFETVNNMFDTLIWLRSECDVEAAEIDCNDDGGNGLASRISAQLEPGTYFLFVDGFGDANAGTTDLVVTVQPL